MTTVPVWWSIEAMSAEYSAANIVGIGAENARPPSPAVSVTHSTWGVSNSPWEKLGFAPAAKCSSFHAWPNWRD